MLYCCSILKYSNWYITADTDILLLWYCNLLPYRFGSFNATLLTLLVSIRMFCSQRYYNCAHCLLLEVPRVIGHVLLQLSLSVHCQLRVHASSYTVHGARQSTSAPPSNERNRKRTSAERKTQQRMCAHTCACACATKIHKQTQTEKHTDIRRCAQKDTGYII